MNSKDRKDIPLGAVSVLIIAAYFAVKHALKQEADWLESSLAVTAAIHLFGAVTKGVFFPTQAQMPNVEDKP